MPKLLALITLTFIINACAGSVVPDSKSTLTLREAMELARKQKSGGYSQKVLSPYETPKYYGPIYPLTEAITLRYGEHPSTTFSISTKIESHEGGKYKNVRQVLGGEITVLSFGPDLEWVIQKLTHEGEDNGQRFTLSFPGAQVNLITSNMGEYKNSKATVPTKIIQHNGDKIKAYPNDKYDLEQYDLELVWKVGGIPNYRFQEDRLSVGDDFGTYSVYSETTDGVTTFGVKGTRLILTGVTYYQGRKNYHLEVTDFGLRNDIDVDRIKRDEIEKIKPDGYILFDSEKGAISYMEIVRYKKWEEDGYENSFRYVQKLERDTHNW